MAKQKEGLIFALEGSVEVLCQVQNRAAKGAQGAFPRGRPGQRTELGNRLVSVTNHQCFPTLDSLDVTRKVGLCLLNVD